MKLAIVGLGYVGFQQVPAFSEPFAPCIASSPARVRMSPALASVVSARSTSPRTSRIVFITKGVDRATVAHSLAAFEAAVGG